jgi:hypothetical protein
MLYLNCKICEKRYSVIPARKGSKFCSLPCYHKSLVGVKVSPKTQFKKGMVPKNKGIKRPCKKGVCLKCGESFINKRNDRVRQYCTRSCASSLKGFQKGQVSWTKGKSKKELEKHYRNGWNGLFQKGQVAPTKGIKYSQERIKAMSGENAPNWQGGRTSFLKRQRVSLNFRNWRTAVFERDDYTCQKCSIRGGELHPHHIKSFSLYEDLRFDVENGSTLCKSCHMSYHKHYGRITHGENYKHFLKSDTVYSSL